jgi:glycosyltransferase involved in cell wall biosynthesis
LDISVLSSVSEGFPNVLGEAMSCGICAVSTVAGDSAWIIGNTGAVASPRDPDMLARAIERLLSMEPEQRRNLGKLARARVIEDFSLPSVVREYEQLYERVLALEPPVGT